MIEAERSANDDAVSPREAAAIAASAYVFGFPLILLDAVHTSVAQLTANATAPSSPRALALFCLDLALAPVVLRVSDAGVQLRDGWSNVVASFGPGAARAFALVGPRWRGPLPAGLERIALPTELGCVIAPATARPFAHDVATVSGAVLAAAVQRVSRMGAGTFLSRLARLMRRNPPSLDDDPLLARLGRIGIGAGEPTRLACLSTELKAALVSGVGAARVALAEQARDHDRFDYARRAVRLLTSLDGALVDGIWPDVN